MKIILYSGSLGSPSHDMQQSVQTKCHRLHSLAVSTNNLPAKNFGVGVHDIQGLFETPILNKADDFTVKGRHVIFVFMQNYDTRDAHQQLK